MIKNSDKETFFSFDSPLLIRDSKQKVFYYHPNKKGEIYFNLPKGTFYTNCDVHKSEIRNYPLLSLPEPEHFFDHKNIKIIKKDNPCKATIYPLKKKIFLDHKISKVDYSPAKVFILAHEFGHLRYRTEKFCDMFAVNFMLSKGYNPSQIAVAYKVLFHKNFDRKDFLNDVFNTKNFVL